MKNSAGEDIYEDNRARYVVYNNEVWSVRYGDFREFIWSLARSEPFSTNPESHRYARKLESKYLTKLGISKRWLPFTENADGPDHEKRIIDITDMSQEEILEIAEHYQPAPEVTCEEDNEVTGVPAPNKPVDSTLRVFGKMAPTIRDSVDRTIDHMVGSFKKDEKVLFDGRLLCDLAADYFKNAMAKRLGI